MSLFPEFIALGLSKAESKIFFLGEASSSKRKRGCRYTNAGTIKSPWLIFLLSNFWVCIFRKGLLFPDEWRSLTFSAMFQMTPNQPFLFITSTNESFCTSGKIKSLIFHTLYFYFLNIWSTALQDYAYLLAMKWMNNK